MELISHKLNDFLHARSLRGLRTSLTVFLFVFFAFFAPRFADGSQLVPDASLNTGPGLPFAAADLDGDHLPDFATVQDARFDRNTTGYLVRLRLSDSGRRYIRVAAPQGGLSVEARDVNGDNAIDLVFSTAWLGKPVAVLLNDGHGNFSQSDPAYFPNAFVDSKTQWNTAHEKPLDASAMLGRSPTGDLRDSNATRIVAPRATAPAIACANLLPLSVHSTYSGRAPPLVVVL